MSHAEDELSGTNERTQAVQIELDYSVISLPPSLEIDQISELDRISDIEVFYWAGCASCYQVDMAIDKFQQGKTELSVRKTPVVSRVAWRSQAYIPEILKQLSPIDGLPSLGDIYKACIQDCGVFQSYEKTKIWLQEFLKMEELPFINEESLWQSEKNHQKRANLFSITQVPTIIINEKYKISATQAKNPARLVEIIDYLLSIE